MVHDNLLELEARAEEAGSLNRAKAGGIKLTRGIAQNFVIEIEKP